MWEPAQRLVEEALHSVLPAGQGEQMRLRQLPHLPPPRRATAEAGCVRLGRAFGPA